MLARFAALPQIVAVIEQGERRAVGVTVEGVPVELVVADAASASGPRSCARPASPAYVAALEPLPDAPDEDGGLRALGIPWCPPELREEPFRGEPPALVELGDIRGDLHCHTTWSDGRASVEEMGRAARERGYDYLAICDHTPAVGAVRGLTADDVRRQAEEIAAANELLAPFRVLRGIECDILARRPARPPRRRARPSSTGCRRASTAASGCRAREMTERVEEALRNPYVRCLSHPTGRLINRRPENALDLERVFEVALEAGRRARGQRPCRPARPQRRARPRRAARRRADRLLDRRALGRAASANMALSVHTARRGWATAADVVNTEPLRSILDRRRP